LQALLRKERYVVQAKLAQNFLQPAVGGVLLDVSCGSGLFSRRFAKTNLFSTVVASDFSENMLRQSYQFIKADKDLDKAYGFCPSSVLLPFYIKNHRVVVTLYFFLALMSNMHQ
jgi:SAM-dependent methyltransferase